jgi:hypothetical protein
LPPFHETAGDNAHYFAPGESPDSAAGRIADHLGRDAAYLLKRRVLTGYTWERLFSERIEPLVQRLPW